MKKIRTVLILIALSFIFFSYVSGEREGDVARIHVVANSDSDTDQEAKMKVVEEISTYLSNDKYSTLDSIEKGLRDSLPEIEEIALEVLSENGFDYGATARVGVEHFEEKTLDTALFKEGDYLALTVVLGEGKGHNWWSVLFPDVTFSASLARGESGREGKRVVLSDGRVLKIRCLIADIISDVIKGDFF